ncbi:MAG: Fic family protein [Paludibacteraceae bacterium]
MQKMGLKGSRSFRQNHLYPAINIGYVAKRYPNNDRHPNQAYYLTPSGLNIFSLLTK